ncbi:MAG TPA: fibronectin type III domain-containing protein [Chthoniobacterales bacterium]
MPFSAKAGMQNPALVTPTAFRPQLGEHVAAREEEMQIPPRAGEVNPGNFSQSSIPVVSTGSTFFASWGSVNAATGYRLDVSQQSSFSSYVTGYRDLDVGNMTGRVVTGLNPRTKYYYRVRAYNGAGTSADSQVMAGTTASGAGLVINATFDSTITTNPNSVVIQSMITQAVSIFENLFSDPITVSILFRYSTTAPDGSPIRGLAGSGWVFYAIPWNTYISALRADATSANDVAANASLPVSALSTNVNPSSANGRAIGLNTPPGIDANGNVGTGPGFVYDGIVTLNSNTSFQFTRPVNSGNYDAQLGTEHEIDEILGLGSHLALGSNDLRPQDLFSWSSPGVRNLTSSGSRYFSIDSGNTDLIDFNQNPSFDFGDWLSPQCPQPNPHVQNAFGCTGRSSDISAGSLEGINLDVIGYNLAPPARTGSASLANISTRMRVLTGDNVLIGGFVISGTTPKQVLVRAIGPTLANFSVPNPLQDPVLDLHNSNSSIALNDDWQTDPNSAQIPANLRPGDSRESAILITLQPGSYTAIVSDKTGATGVGLVEVYSMDNTSSSQLTNVSTRGLVQTGDFVMIGGFISTAPDGSSAQLLIRAIGPSLAQFGIGALPDPTLRLIDGNGVTIAFDDNWKDTQQAEIQATGIAPVNDMESAILATLSPGSYTALVSGANGSTGVGLVEVFKLR